MRRLDGSARGLLVAALALLTTAAAGQVAPSPRPSTPSASAPAPAVATGSPSTGDTPQGGSAQPRGAQAPASLRPRLSPAGAAAASPLVVTAATPLSEGLRGVGGDAAPVCRAGCAPAFYACSSNGGGDGSCHVALATCRRACDAQAPAAGRLQSPLPAAGLAPAGPLRPLPGGLPALQ